MTALPQVVGDAVELAEGPLDGAVRERTRWVLADTVSVMLAGTRREPARSLLTAELTGGSWTQPERSEHAPSRVLGTSRFASAERAAFLSAAGLTDLEMDEGTRPTGHPAAHVLPALLAVAEAVDGTVGQVERSLVLGYEVAGHLLSTYRLAPGVHPHGHLVSLAAAAAVAHLGGRDPLRAAEIAATTAMRVSSWSAPREGADARNLWTAGSASDAVTALRLLESGWTGSATVLEELFDGVIAETIEEAPRADDSPRIMNGYFKVYPSCALTHASIEAALELPALQATSIRSVHVRTIGANLKVAGQPADSPLGRRFSIPFAVATALLSPQPHVADFDQPLPGAMDLAARVSVAEDPALTALWPHAAPSIVEVTRKDGSILSARCDNPRGARPGSIGARNLRGKSAMLLGDSGDAWDLLIGAAPDALVREVLDRLSADPG